MYEELIKALRICGSGHYPNPCPFSINERCTFGCWMDTGRKAASALETLTAQLTALQSENAEKDKKIERLKKCRHECKIDCLLEEYNRVKAERDTAKPSAEVLEAIDELVEFARDRMSIGVWLGYVNVLNDWRSAQGEG